MPRSKSSVKKYSQTSQTRVHEYLRDDKYAYCHSCKNRTPFTCSRCGYCWSCHWLKEEIERPSSPAMISNRSIWLAR